MELAAQAEIPLWSDDVVIRALAASQDIPAFGTLALLHALIEDNTLPDTLRTDVQALAAARVVDLTLTPDELLHLAAADGWQPEAAATVVTRPAYWASYQPALDTFLQLIGNVSAQAPATIPTWLAAACHGLAASIPATDIPTRLADLAARHRSQPVRRHPNPRHANPDRPRRSPPIRPRALKFPGKPAP